MITDRQRRDGYPQRGDACAVLYTDPFFSPLTSLTRNPFFIASSGGAATGDVLPTSVSQPWFPVDRSVTLYNSSVNIDTGYKHFCRDQILKSYIIIQQLTLMRVTAIKKRYPNDKSLTFDMQLINS